MEIHYYCVTDEVHGRPIIEVKSSDINGLKDEFHPFKLSKDNIYTFIDILLENENNVIEKNEEALRLKELLDIPQDVIEEIITDQRPRADKYSDFYLILFKSFSIQSTYESLMEHQVGILVRKNIVITIHKTLPTLKISKVFNRFNKYPLKIAQGGITFFVLTYLDLMIDQIYFVLDFWSKIIDIIERKLIEEPKKYLLNQVVELRHRLLDLIKILQADREVINSLRSFSKDLFNNDIIPPELDDHIKHMLDETDILRNLLNNVRDLYYHSDNSKLNDIMMKFTVITSLLLFPSIITGVLGMNNYSGSMSDFWLSIILMIVSVFVLYFIFKKKKYI
ncbi:MAG: magnesium transporter CorA family protein [Promethearchaeota archaeon]